MEGALALAKVTEEDPFTGLPEAAEFGAAPGDLHLYYDDVYSLAGPERIEWARRAEAAALSADARITNSDGGSFDASTGRKALANSRGFVGGYCTSYAGVAAPRRWPWTRHGRPASRVASQIRFVDQQRKGRKAIRHVIASASSQTHLWSSPIYRTPATILFSLIPGANNQRRGKSFAAIVVARTIGYKCTLRILKNDWPRDRRFTMHSIALRMTMGLILLTFVRPAMAQTRPAGSISIQGDIASPQSWTPDQIRSSFAKDGKTLQYTLKGIKHSGYVVPLMSLINAGGPKIDPRIKSHELRFVVVIEARDGYTAAIDLADLMPAIGNHEAWIALDMDESAGGLRPAGQPDHPRRSKTHAGCTA